MKTGLFRTIIAVAAISVAALMTSCNALKDAINDATEVDIEVPDFDIKIDTKLAVPAGADLTRADGEGAHFAGSYTITRAELLEDVDDFAFDLIRDVKFDEVTIKVEQELGEITIEHLTLACEGLDSFVINDTPVNSIGAAQAEALTTLATGIVMKVVRDGEATVSIDATLDKPIDGDTVSYLIALSGITITAGLNL